MSEDEFFFFFFSKWDHPGAAEWKSKHNDYIGIKSRALCQVTLTLQVEDRSDCIKTPLKGVFVILTLKRMGVIWKRLSRAHGEITASYLSLKFSRPDGGRGWGSGRDILKVSSAALFNVAVLSMDGITYRVKGARGGFLNGAKVAKTDDQPLPFSFLTSFLVLLCGFHPHRPRL